MTTDETRLLSLTTLKNEMTDCQKCEYRKNASQVVLPVGNINADVMFLDSWPDKISDVIGTPVSGRPGKLLGKVIAEAGIEQNRCYIGYVNKCIPGISTVSVNKYRTCFDSYTHEEIKLVRPKAIVMLGVVPARLLLASAALKLQSVIGQTFNVLDTPVYPWYNVNWTMQNGRKTIVAFTNLLKKVKAECLD